MKRVVSKAMIILELLNDGKWHRIEELFLSSGLNEPKFQEITGFLNKYSFVVVDEETKKIKVNSDFRRLLVQPIT